MLLRFFFLFFFNLKLKENKKNLLKKKKKHVRGMTDSMSNWESELILKSLTWTSTTDSTRRHCSSPNSAPSASLTSPNASLSTLCLTRNIHFHHPVMAFRWLWFWARAHLMGPSARWRVSRHVRDQHDVIALQMVELDQLEEWDTLALWLS